MTYHAYVAADGRLTVPADVAEELGLRPGDMVAVARDGESVRITREARAATDAFGRLRQALQGYTVDRFLAERRDDWRE